MIRKKVILINNKASEVKENIKLQKEKRTSGRNKLMKLMTYTKYSWSFMSKAAENSILQLKELWEQFKCRSICCCSLR